MDLTLKIENNKKFNCRVGMIIQNKNRFLIQNYSDSGIYSLIGGRIKFKETSLDAAIRECYEETGIKIKKKELKFVTIVENFFEHKDNQYHELLFIYQVNNDKLMNINNHLCKDDPKNSNCWYNMTELKKLNLKPNILTKIIKGFNSIPIYHVNK